MRFVFVAVLLVACSTRQNPNVCCENEAQCAEVGFDDLQPCGVGQVCGADHTCIAAECTTNSECGDDAPVCRSGFCESMCVGDEDCAGVAGRTHCSNMACVECSANEHCSAAAPYCDAEDLACRGCERDSECASGVCIEIDATCAEEVRVVYAAGTTAATTGECGRNAPCKLEYALTKVRSDRDVVHLTTGTASLPPSTFDVIAGLVIDGAPTEISTSGSVTFAISSSGTLTLSSVLLDTGFHSASTGGVTRLFDVQIDRSRIETNGGTLVIDQSAIMGDQVNELISCSGGGTFSLHRSQMQGAIVGSNGCAATIARNRFSTAGTATVLRTMGGKAIVENNVFVTSDSGTDMVYMLGGVGSEFRFNTVVSTNSTVYSASALYCDAAIGISNNIFAFNSTNPIQGTGTCNVTSSLFDTQGTGDAGTNLVGDRAEFFVALAQTDFHLAMNSPARNAGQSGLVDVDLEGTPRDATPDLGAYEMP